MSAAGCATNVEMSAASKRTLDEAQRARVLAGAGNRRRAVIDAGERDVRVAARELARDLSGTAPQIDRVPHAVQVFRGQVREPPDRDVSRIRERERIVALGAEERVVEFAIGRR